MCKLMYKKIILLLFCFTAPVLAQQTSENWNVDCTQNNVCLLRTLNSENIFGENASGENPSRVSIGVVETDREKLWFINAFYPTNISITKGVGFRIDENAIVELTLQTCNSNSCRASGALDVIALEQLKKGNNLHLVYTNSDSENTLQISYSLVGFAKSFNQFILEIVK